MMPNLIARHYSYSQNLIISFGYVDFKPKTFLLLYPSLENSTAGVAILHTFKTQLVVHRSFFFMKPKNSVPFCNIRSYFVAHNKRNWIFGLHTEKRVDARM